MKELEVYGVARPDPAAMNGERGFGHHAPRAEGSIGAAIRFWRILRISRRTGSGPRGLLTSLRRRGRGFGAAGICVSCRSGRAQIIPSIRR
jgi:hypothetical protein